MATTIPDARDLAAVADLVTWLGLSNPTQDVQDQLQRLLTAVSLWVQNWLGRQIKSQSYRDIRDGHGGNRISLSDYPVSAIASVIVDGEAIPQAAGPNLPGWRLVHDQVILYAYRFSPGDANVEVHYTAGYTTIPPELAQACLELASLRWKERDRIGHVSKSIGGETVQFMVKDLPESVRSILNDHRKVVVP